MDLRHMKIVIVAVHFYILMLPSTQVEARSLLFRAVRSSCNPQFYEKFNMSLHDKALNVDIVQIRDINNGFRVSLDFKMLSDLTKNYQTLFHYDMDFCQTLKSVRQSIFHKWFKSLIHSSNINYKCPLPKGRYLLKQWRMENALIPSFMPNGAYRINGRSYFKAKNHLNESFINGFEFDAQFI